MTNPQDISVIEKLQRLSPEDRLAHMQETYEKNRKYFKTKMPVLEECLNKVKCEYRIDITEKFLNIVSEATGQLGHPEAGLDSFAMMMGDWVHNAWVDLFNIKVVSSGQNTIHDTPVRRIFDFMKNNCPTYRRNYASGQLNLKVLSDERRFSPPVVFLGIFHGLHIDYFLSKTETPTILFIEPDTNRFEVSCYFLDYETIRENIKGGVYFALGGEGGDGAVQKFFRKTRITPLLWTRVLPGYVSSSSPVIIENLKMLQTVRSDIFYPLDFELQGLLNGLSQIKKKRPLLSHKIKTSPQCKIAIVATGPSLTNDLIWLKKNQDKVIIFAVHSSVISLKAHGILPDFQFSLDIRQRKSGNLEKLELCQDKPLIQFYKATDDYFNLTKDVFMVAERYKPDPVKMQFFLEYTHPSTTCLAFSFADFCSPQEIYLLGCDFGYRSTEQDHVAGSIYDKMEETKDKAYSSNYGKTLQAVMSPNFKNTGLIQTTAFLSHAKIAIERRIETSMRRYKVYNMSDGVEIRHTIAKKSSKTNLPKYSKKQNDIKKIKSAFKNAEINNNWYPFPEEGKKMFDEIKQMVIDGLTLEAFSWVRAANAFDCILEKLHDYCKNKNDLRMSIFERVIADLLSAMYICLLFHDSASEADTAYKLMIRELKNIFDEDLYWPKELDPQ